LTSGRTPADYAETARRLSILNTMNETPAKKAGDAYFANKKSRLASAFP
jgi:hypothetical protein